MAQDAIDIGKMHQQTLACFAQASKDTEKKGAKLLSIEASAKVKVAQAEAKQEAKAAAKRKRQENKQAEKAELKRQAANDRRFFMPICMVQN